MPVPPRTSPNVLCTDKIVARNPARLPIDTSVARRPGPSPKQVFPCRTDGRAEPRAGSGALQRAFRPPPLPLEPSEAVNGIGVVLSCPGPSHPDHAESRPQSGLQIRNQSSRQMTRPPAPTIVVTPAEEDFPEETQASHKRRPTSSVYSRLIDDRPKLDLTLQAPPVPTIPISLDTSSVVRPRKMTSRGEARPIKEPNRKVSGQKPKRLVVPLKTTSTPVDSQRLRDAPPLTAGLPTPRRSTGWWNYVTSPFSAKSTTAPFWRSPPMREDSPDQQPILQNAAPMGKAGSYAAISVLQESEDDPVLRSAPLQCSLMSPSQEQMSLKRSDTAPGTLETNKSGVNIYRVPSQGLAAAYYDMRKRFPSLYVSTTNERNVGTRAVEELPSGWSPSQSVFAMPIPPARGLAADYYDTSKDFSSPIDATTAGSPGHRSVDGSATTDFTSPEAEEEEEEGGSILQRGALPNVSDRPTAARTVTTEPTPKVPVADSAVFSTPSVDEMSGPVPMPDVDHGAALDMTMSHFSPLSATPTVESAHVATFIGPRSVYGEPREVDVTQERDPGPRLETSGEAAPARGPPQLPPSPELFGHARKDSQGLGIFDEKREAIATPPPASVRPQLNDDTPYAQPETSRDLEGQRRPTPWLRRLLMPLTVVAGLLTILTIVLVIMLLPGNVHGMAVEAEWMNTTGFPAMPVGVSTIIQPKSSNEDGTCVASAELWSCADPGSAQTVVPDFRFEILFRSGVLPKNETSLMPDNSTEARNQSSGDIRMLKRDKNQFSPWPALPSQADRIFMAQTTDNVSAPYDGEATPFYISLLQAVALSDDGNSGLQKRDSNFTYPYPDASSTNTSTTGTSKVPAPHVLSNGSAANPLLYPLAISQPLHLFNRGLDSEQYSFYTYFDRSLYVAGNDSASQMNGSNTSNATGAAVCTWSQTRFHVQIWTRKGFVDTLPAAGGNDTSTSIPAANSTANDMTAPGSFPYPVTVTLDRHGGRADKKGVYCYAVVNGTVQTQGGWWVDEDRGGGLVDPAQVPGDNNGTLAGRDVQGSGIDGGSGGCSCQWSSQH